jgi:transposase
MQAPRDDVPDLPEDAAALRALVLSMTAERDALIFERDALLSERATLVSERDVIAAERDVLLQRNERLAHLLVKLQRMQFGRKSERLPDEQLQLGFEDLEQGIARNDAEAEKRDPELRDRRAAKRRASRGALPAHLPRIEITLAPEHSTCPCCRAAMTVIGEDTSERLDVVPAQYRVIVTRRPKLLCRACAGMVQHPAPARLIAGGIPTEALVAHVAVLRFADHQPLYRQAQMMARQGVIVERSTLACWIGYAAAEIAPVVARLRELVLGAARVFADETVVPVLDPGRGRTRQGYFWAVARDDRAWGGCDPPAVVYSYAPGRGQLHAKALLGGYRGVLQCDGYAAYKRLVDRTVEAGGITLAFCWSHVRRGFYDLARTGAAPIAAEALARIAALYRIESGIRGQSAEQRLAVRQAKSRALVAELVIWFAAQLPKLPARSPTAEAIRYALNHWGGLAQFLADGQIELDTNSVERALRPIALSRKNSLFAGCNEGAANWAAFASLIETCKLNNVEPQGYLTQLLTRLVNGWPQSRIDDLMPWLYAPAQTH